MGNRLESRWLLSPLFCGIAEVGTEPSRFTRLRQSLLQQNFRAVPPCGSRRKTSGVFFILKGLDNKAQGCGTPLPWEPASRLIPTLKGLRNADLRNPFRVGYGDYFTFTQGSGVPQPWALIGKPFGLFRFNFLFFPAATSG